MTGKKTYNNSSISSLKGADRVRLRPGVIFGSDGIEGCKHTFFEILSNSIDEAREGHGNVIEITKFTDKSIEVRDHGRGIPLEWNEKEGRYNYELVFEELYAGGKYGNEDDDNYEYSLGLNGLGSCATQYASEYMDVEVTYGRKRFNLHFEKGKNIGGLTENNMRSKETGTTIKWRPDLDVFTDIDIPLEYFQDILKKQAVVNGGLKFILFDEESDEKFEYIYENGIIDYVKELDNNKGFTSCYYYETENRGRDRADKKEYKIKAQVAFSFNNDINLIEYYHNSSHLEHGGSPEKAVKVSFIHEIDRYIKKNGMYTKNEKKISFVDIEDSLILVTNSFSTQTSYENQTKKAITNKFIQEALTEFLRHNLEIMFIENKMEADKVANQILANKRSREKAEKARVNIRKKLSGNLDMTNRVKKFVDCRVKDIEKREIFIVEGDSALGSCKMGRDAEFQAIIPVRGKILNCLKADYDRIFSSEIIVDLLRVLGCGVEIESKHSKELHTFNIDKLKWNKVIIATDADVDGFQIRTLIVAMLYRLVPSLIEFNKIYIAETPLFEITSGKKTYFAFNEKEKSNILKKLEGKKFNIQRSKGLGENDPEMMWETTMDPKRRRLIQITAESLENDKKMFDTLLGEDLQSRKEFIAEHGHKFMDMLDVS